MFLIFLYLFLFIYMYCIIFENSYALNVRQHNYFNIIGLVWFLQTCQSVWSLLQHVAMILVKIKLIKRAIRLKDVKCWNFIFLSTFSKCVQLCLNSATAYISGNTEIYLLPIHTLYTLAYIFWRHKKYSQTNICKRMPSMNRPLVLKGTLFSHIVEYSNLYIKLIR